MLFTYVSIVLKMRSSFTIPIMRPPPADSRKEHKRGEERRQRKERSCLHAAVGLHTPRVYTAAVQNDYYFLLWK